MFKYYLNSKNYFYESIKDIEVYSDLLKGVYFNNDFIEINNGSILVHSGYVFNGASPRFEWFGCEWGTPQGRGLSGLRGFCVHDALYQYRKEIGISKAIADKVQLMIHKKDNFKPASLYYYVLRIINLIKK